MRNKIYFKKPTTHYEGPDFRKSLAARNRRRGIRINSGMPKVRGTGTKINIGLMPKVKY